MSLTRLDPRIKLLLLIGLSTVSFITQKPAALLALFLLTVMILLLGGVTPATIWTKLRGMFGLILMIFLMQCVFTRSGEPALALNGVTLVTENGIQTAVLVGLRLLIIVLSALTVALGESRDYLLALTQCKVPYEIAFLVLAAMRFLPMLREEARDVLCAAQMRGLRIKKAGLRKQVAAYMSIVLPVLAGAIRRAEQLSVSMEARGFRAFPRRTSMRRLRMRSADWLYLAAFCLILSAILILSYYSEVLFF